VTALDRPAPRALEGELSLPHFGISKWVLAGVLLASASAMLPVFQNSSVTSRGLDLQSLEAEKDALRAEMSLLEADVARLTSLERIARRAREIGLFPSGTAFYVTVTEAGPAPAKIPAEYLLRPSEPSSEPAPWWRSLLEAIPLLN